VREMIFCKSYRAMSNHDTCKAGVEYDSLKGIDFNSRPCFKRNGKNAPCGCVLAAFPTDAEIKAQDEEFAAHFAQTMVARALIVEDCGGDWKKGMRSASGEIDCPVCEKGKLRYSRAGYNGHIHASCTTEGCVSWME
jgi:hypothetical protein